MKITLRFTIVAQVAVSGVDLLEVDVLDGHCWEWDRG